MAVAVQRRSDHGKAADRDMVGAQARVCNRMNANNVVGIVRNTRWALGAAVLLACAGIAQAAGQLALDGAVYQEVEVRTPEGEVVTRRVPAAKVVPGGEVVYEISFSNTGDAPVTN